MWIDTFTFILSPNFSLKFILKFLKKKLNLFASLEIQIHYIGATNHWFRSNNKGWGQSHQSKWEDQRNDINSATSKASKLVNCYAIVNDGNRAYTVAKSTWKRIPFSTNVVTREWFPAKTSSCMVLYSLCMESILFTTVFIFGLF